MKRVLVAGWFSFEEMGATAGDLASRDLACAWLREARRAYDVAVAPPFTDGIDWQQASPADYSEIVFVCGPFGNGEPIPPFLEHFVGIPLVGLNLSMLQPLEEWNPFAFLLERDSSRTSRPDLVFSTTLPSVPVVGRILVGPQEEYDHDRHHLATAALDRLIKRREMAIVDIDTRLDINATGLRTPSEVESLIARMDVVLTTRLHGLVLALKNGVPAVAVDPIAGGAKMCRQAETIGWPLVFTADALTDQQLEDALDYCLTDEARAAARECGEQAGRLVGEVRRQFIDAVSTVAKQ